MTGQKGAGNGKREECVQQIQNLQIAFPVRIP